MSRLDELIQELCPDGVPFIKIQDCCSLEKGKTPIQKANPGEYPLVVTTTARKSANTYQFDKPSVCIPLVSSRGHGVASLNEVFYQDGRFALGNILCAVTPLNPDYLSAKFLHAYLNYAKDILLVPQMKGGANVSLSVDAIGRCKIPVPPIKVQHEIVRILDKFTTLTAELTAELTARQKQYSFYREKLLTFKTSETWKEIGELFDVRNGYTPSKSNSEYWENGTVPWVRMEDIRSNGRIVHDTIQKVNESAVKRAGLFPAGSVLISTTATIGEHAMLMVDALTNQQITCLTINSDYSNLLIPKFVFYYANILGEWCKKNVNKGGGLPIISIDKLKRFRFPVPPVAVQQHIVNILDNFDAICSDLQSGLPAEIEARKKQYEYYREKLLSFKPLS